MGTWTPAPALKPPVAVAGRAGGRSGARRTRGDQANDQAAAGPARRRRHPPIREDRGRGGAARGAGARAAELPEPPIGDLAEFCAVVREAARRALGMRPYDVQLVGTLALLDGHVAEMATGEGKTLSGALAAVGLRAARPPGARDLGERLPRPPGRRVDGPAVRGARRVRRVDRPDLDPRGAQRPPTPADVTYAPVSEIGFDVLRDRLVTDPDDLIVPEPGVAIVDEADSVLVDEARVPLVLAGAAERGPARPRPPRWCAGCQGLPLRDRRGGPQRLPHPEGHRRGGGRARRHRPVRRGERRPAHRGQPGAARARAARPGRRLHRPGRQGAADQHLPRPGGAAAALAGRAAGRGRGEGVAAAERDRPHPRLDHRAGA